MHKPTKTNPQLSNHGEPQDPIKHEKDCFRRCPSSCGRFKWPEPQERYEAGAEALEHVEKGLELVKIIDNALPEYRVNTTDKVRERHLSE